VHKRCRCDGLIRVGSLAEARAPLGSRPKASIVNGVNSGSATNGGLRRLRKSSNGHNGFPTRDQPRLFGSLVTRTDLLFRISKRRILKDHPILVGHGNSPQRAPQKPLASAEAHALLYSVSCIPYSVSRILLLSTANWGSNTGTRYRATRVGNPGCSYRSWGACSRSAVPLARSQHQPYLGSK
jgi:hypothetical protein